MNEAPTIPETGEEVSEPLVMDLTPKWVDIVGMLKSFAIGAPNQQTMNGFLDELMKPSKLCDKFNSAMKAYPGPNNVKDDLDALFAAAESHIDILEEHRPCVAAERLKGVHDRLTEFLYHLEEGRPQTKESGDDN